MRGLRIITVHDQPSRRAPGARIILLLVGFVVSIGFVYWFTLQPKIAVASTVDAITHSDGEKLAHLIDFEKFAPSYMNMINMHRAKADGADRGLERIADEARYAREDRLMKPMLTEDQFPKMFKMLADERTSLNEGAASLGGTATLNQSPRPQPSAPFGEYPGLKRIERFVTFDEYEVTLVDASTSKPSSFAKVMFCRSGISRWRLCRLIDFPT